MDTISTEYLRRNLPAIWPRVDGGGESFEVTYHGRAVFRIVPAKGFAGVIPGLALIAEDPDPEGYGGAWCSACGAGRAGSPALLDDPCPAWNSGGQHQIHGGPSG